MWLQQCTEQWQVCCLVVCCVDICMHAKICGYDCSRKMHQQSFRVNPFQLILTANVMSQLQCSECGVCTTQPTKHKRRCCWPVQNRPLARTDLVQLIQGLALYIAAILRFEARPDLSHLVCRLCLVEAQCRSLQDAISHLALLRNCCCASARLYSTVSSCLSLFDAVVSLHLDDTRY